MRYDRLKYRIWRLLPTKYVDALNTGLAVAIVFLPVYALLCVGLNWLCPEYAGEIAAGWVLWFVLSWVEMEK